MKKIENFGSKIKQFSDFMIKNRNKSEISKKFSDFMIKNYKKSEISDF